MAITRTPWIDDDGSGTTGTIINNAEKTLLYDQIDAAIASAPLTNAAVAFSLTDTSGAGLGVLGVGRYIRIGQVVCVWAQPVYPSTANGLGAKLGGFPFPNNATLPSGMYLTYGPAVVWHMGLGGTEIVPLAPGTMAVQTNAQMSGSNNALVGVYFTTV